MSLLNLRVTVAVITICVVKTREIEFLTTAVVTNCATAVTKYVTALNTVNTDVTTTLPSRDLAMLLTIDAHTTA